MLTTLQKWFFFGNLNSGLQVKSFAHEAMESNCIYEEKNQNRPSRREKSVKYEVNSTERKYPQISVCGHNRRECAVGGVAFALEKNRILRDGCCET